MPLTPGHVARSGRGPAAPAATLTSPRPLLVCAEQHYRGRTIRRAAPREGAAMTADDIPLGDLPLIETDVLVVGAGPTGLMAGLVLARRGLRAEVIDSKAGPTRESRAIVVDRKSTRLNSSHVAISYAVFCLKKKTTRTEN